MWKFETRNQMIQLVLKRSLEEMWSFERNLMPSMIWESGWWDLEKSWKILFARERTWDLVWSWLKVLVEPVGLLAKSLGAWLPHTQ